MNIDETYIRGQFQDLRGRVINVEDTVETLKQQVDDIHKLLHGDKGQPALFASMIENQRRLERHSIRLERIERLTVQLQIITIAIIGMSLTALIMAIYTLASV